MVGSQEEVLLIVLPFVEPSEEIACLRGRFPEIRIIFHHAAAPSGGTVKLEQQVPTGTLASPVQGSITDKL
jgi:hypothetical protein